MKDCDGSGCGQAHICTAGMLTGGMSLLEESGRMLTCSLNLFDELTGMFAGSLSLLDETAGLFTGKVVEGQC